MPTTHHATDFARCSCGFLTVPEWFLTVLVYILGMGRARFAWVHLAPTTSNPSLNYIVLRMNSVRIGPGDDSEEPGQQGSGRSFSSLMDTEVIVLRIYRYSGPDEGMSLDIVTARNFSCDNDRNTRLCLQHARAEMSVSQGLWRLQHPPCPSAVGCH